MLFIIIMGIIIGIIILILLTFFGVKLCNKNNALGIVLLFLSLNIIGLILGCCLLYNNNHSKINLPINNNVEL